MSIVLLNHRRRLVAHEFRDGQQWCAARYERADEMVTQAVEMQIGVDATQSQYARPCLAVRLRRSRGLSYTAAATAAPRC